MKTNTRAHLTNLHCLCKTLDRQELSKVLDQKKEWQDISKENGFFSDTAIYLSPTEIEEMKNIITRIESVMKLDQFREKVLQESPGVAKLNLGPKGVFMGYDFHLSESGPKLIEINTNAGGAYLNLLLTQAQIQCCPDVHPVTNLARLEEQFVEMFKNEWKLQGRKEDLKSVAIIDTRPEEQFLYREFKLYQELFQRNGITCVIADPEVLDRREDGLYFNSLKIDLIYNRLTDFYITDENYQHLKNAFENGEVVLTPNPHHHALFARKCNLQLLTDPVVLRKLGASEDVIAALCQGIPRTIRVSSENQNYLWANKKNYFFKPVSGFGSKATYRGDKLTLRVWEDILRGDYVAQELVKAPLRSITADGETRQLKFDVRAYTYDGNILLLAARLYSGQTTNFRTVGGGFAPVYVLE